MRVNILKYAEVCSLLDPYEDEVNQRLYKSKLVDPLNHVFINDDESILFCMHFVGMGLYDMHIYTDPSVKVSLSSISEFCKECASSVKKSNADMVGAINIVKKEDRHLRVMMHRLFGSKVIQKFKNGNVMFFTDIAITEV